MNLPLLYSFDDLVATVPFGERKMRTVLNDMGYGSGKGNKMAFSFAQIVEIQERVACLIDSCRQEPATETPTSMPESQSLGTNYNEAQDLEL
jgi:hypothetical protein